MCIINVKTLTGPVHRGNMTTDKVAWRDAGKSVRQWPEISGKFYGRIFPDIPRLATKYVGENNKIALVSTIISVIQSRGLAGPIYKTSPFTSLSRILGEMLRQSWKQLNIALLPLVLIIWVPISMDCGYPGVHSVGTPFWPLRAVVHSAE